MKVVSTKQEKMESVKELHEKFEKAGLVILTEYKGLTVAQLTEIRNRLRGCGSEYKVVKNTLARRASEGTEVHQVEGHFTGATGILISKDDIISPVKILNEYINKFESFKAKVGVLEGLVLDPGRIKSVANMPSREVLIGKALGGIKSPIYGLAGTLQGILSKLAYAINAVKDARAAG